jgi:plasmid stability protein
MALNLSIKGVPEALAERLRQRAARNHRSLQGELMAIIEAAASDFTAAPAAAPAAAARGREVIVRRGTKTVEQVAAELRALYPEPVADLPRSVDIVRQMRDTR